MLELEAAVGGRAAEVAEVGEVEVAARAVAAETGDVGDGQRGVAQQLVGHAALVGLAEIDTAHSGEQEDERVDVADAGTIASGEEGGVGAAAGEEAQVVIHDADARRVEVTLQGDVLHLSVLREAAAVCEGRDVELVEGELRLALELAGGRILLATAPVVAVPSVYYSVSYVCLRV